VFLKILTKTSRIRGEGREQMEKGPILAEILVNNKGVEEGLPSFYICTAPSKDKISQLIGTVRQKQCFHNPKILAALTCLHLSSCQYPIIEMLMFIYIILYLKITGC
jgi:hypothetical protein